MGGDRNPQSIASAFLLSFPFHNTLVSGGGRGEFVGQALCPSRGDPDSSVPDTEAGREGRERGRSSQAQKLDLGGTFHSHPVLGICSVQPFPARALPIPETFQPCGGKGWPRNPFRVGNFLRRSREARSRGRAGLPAGFQESKLILCNLSGCGTVLLCVWCARGE